VVKRTVTMYVDSENVEIAKARGINLSQLFNDVLKTTLEMPETQEDDTKPLEEKIKKLQYDKAVVIQQLNAIQRQLKQKEDQEKKIKEEREKKVVYRVTT